MLTPGAGQRTTVGITGANGYLGRILSKGLRDEGFEVVELIRPQAGRQISSNLRLYDLATPISSDLLSGLDALIHGAWDLRLLREADVFAVNVDGTRRLIEAAAEAGCGRLVFISSVSAFEGTTQLYGRAKLAAEQAVLGAGGVVVRPGLVYGPTDGGISGILRRISSLPLVPLVGGRAKQFTVHEDDLATAVVALLRTEAVPSSPLTLAYPEPVTFRSLLRRLAKESGHNPRFLPVPWQLLYGVLRLAEATGAKLPIRSDSLLGLMKGPTAAPDLAAVSALGVQLRSFSP